MKTWNTPEVVELNISETASGFLKVGVEGPYNIVFGEKNTDKKPSTTPSDENPANQNS